MIRSLHSMTAAGQRPSAAGVRPEVQSFLDQVAASDITGIKHTTRGMPRKQQFEPQAPQTFAAGRFQVDFRAADGTDRAMIFQTEAGVGHLRPVTPGKTSISGGYVALLSDPKDSHSETHRLNPKELDYLLKSAYQRFDQPMTSGEAEMAQGVLNYTAAVRFSGQGEEAVTRRHYELTQ